MKRGDRVRVKRGSMKGSFGTIRNIWGRNLAYSFESYATVKIDGIEGMVDFKEEVLEIVKKNE